MISIHTNLSSLITQSNLKQSSNGLNQAIERMSTGYKINSAKDNAANHSISTNLTTKIGAYQVAEENTAMGLDMVNTASSTLSEIESKLSRLRDLQEQATNGTYGKQSLRAINKEANALVDEIQRLYNSAEYNKISLFKDQPNDSSMPVAQYDGFIEKVTKQTPDVVVTDPTKLAEAIQNNTIIGISNAETLAELATLVNSGNFCIGKTIVLTNNIDLGEWCYDHLDENGEGGWIAIGKSGKSFQGTFDGNGYKVSNLYINRPTGKYEGLFGYVGGGEIKNVGVVNIEISGNAYTGGLVGNANSSSIISNCYSTGSVTGQVERAGGLVGASGNSSIITNSYSTVDVTGYGKYTGGLVGVNSSSTINNCYSIGSVIGYEIRTGGLVGENYNSATISNSYTTSKVVGTTEVGAFVGISSGDTTIIGSTYYSSINEGLVGVGKTVTTITSDMLMDKVTPPGQKTDLQVGVNDGESSEIGIETSLTLNNIDTLRSIGLNTTKDYLSIIDEMLATVSSKQTKYGAAQNRLLSALEEISIQRENLVSARSTIRDADIADESSEYIKMQILQQASATLLATANQTPAIALQLI